MSADAAKAPLGEAIAECFRVEVTVNGRPVVLERPKLTGLEIKEAAIAQRVPIELSFVLQEELPNGHSRIVGDADVVHIKEHERFTAIPSDDNS